MKLLFINLSKILFVSKSSLPYFFLFPSHLIFLRGSSSSPLTTSHFVTSQISWSVCSRSRFHGLRPHRMPAPSYALLQPRLGAPYLILLVSHHCLPFYLIYLFYLIYMSLLGSKSLMETRPTGHTCNIKTDLLKH